MQRVLMLVTDLQPGGTPLRIVRLARLIAQKGIEPVVGCLAGPGPLHDVLRDAGIATFDCGASHRFDAGSVVRLARHVRRFNPSLIHSTLFHANVAARCVGRIDRPRPILTSSATIEIERRWHRLGEALTIGLSDLHVANSNAVAEHLHVELGFPRERLAVIPNPVDIEAIDAAAPIDRAAIGLRDDVPLIVWVGRMDPIKGIDTLIDALMLLRERACAQAVFVGDGPMRGELERRAAMLVAAGDVRFIGWRTDVAGWLKTADVFAFPSRTEGSPNVVLEAMVAGCAIVASDIPAMADLAGAEERALLVRGYQVPTSWAGRLAEALEDVDATGARRKAARRFVEAHHRPESVAERWFANYANLVQ